MQLRTSDGAQRVAATVDDGRAYLVDGIDSTYRLALAALDTKSTLRETVAARLSRQSVELAEELHEGRVLAPINHPDSAHLYLTGTGLTHLGSAEGRDKMHREAAGKAATDSMRMFMLGVEGGKPAPGEIGAQPEWFYKGDGSALVDPGMPLPSPSFALDGSEEPELAGIYIIDGAGNPRRLGFCLANEFSDHVTERGNYLWLAHSKLRAAALGPELVDEIPQDIRGASRILREGETIWEKPFLTGEANMSHAISNLEHHHFKYGLFRRPGDVHVHFFGTATLSFAEGIRTRPGDVFEIEAPPFRLPLRNSLGAVAESRIAVTAL
ncbi:MAG TPA: AraD1 family protein [Woeseiaceae bacterium]|nr:AraD1 family protein [Woeseiaceae bacterium]